LRKALIEAECDNQAKADFLVTASHELRAPLNAIVGSANMLAEQIYGPLGSENIINTPVSIKFT
jgi:two-component system CheB/CheR fusion protein